MKRAAVAKPASALRSRLTNTTRQVIVDALVAQLAERDVLDISYAELARRAGVSIQTLYRHYPTRADLHDALTRRVGAALAVTEYPQTREGVVALVRALFPRFDANAQLLVAQIHAGAGGESRAKGRKRRGNAFQVVLASAVPSVPAERRRAAAGVMNLLVSVNTWYRLRDELGLDGAAIGDIAGWAVDALWRALEIDDERARRGRAG